MPSLSRNKNKMAIPSQLNPVDSVCIPVNVPNDAEWIGMFLGAIYRLSQQIWYDRDENHSAKIVAARWQDVYLETLKATWDCGALDLFDIRVDPLDDCSIQKTLDGVTWNEVFRLDSPCSVTKIRRNPATGRIGYVMEDFTFYEFPDGPYIPPVGIVYPEPKQRTTSADVSRCNGAYATALALQMLYRETWGNLAQLATTGAFVFMRELSDISSVVLGAIGLFDEYFNIVEDLAQQSALFTDGGFPDTYLEEVQNILYCRSSFVDGAVYFDHAGVVSDFQALSASGPYGGLAGLLGLWINEDALNSAGNIDAGVGDCSAATCYSGQVVISEPDPTIAQANWTLSFNELTGVYTYTGYPVNAGGSWYAPAIARRGGGCMTVNTFNQTSGAVYDYQNHRQDCSGAWVYNANRNGNGVSLQRLRWRHQGTYAAAQNTITFKVNLV